MDQHLAFLISQAAHIEQDVYRVQYPDIQYHELVPIDMTAYSWARTITHFSQDQTGEMQAFSARSNNIPLADISQQKHEVTIEMGALGYHYDREEIEQAMHVPNVNLQSDRAMAARRGAEEYIDNITLKGSADRGWDGLINNTNVTAVDAAAGAAGGRDWASKTAEEVIKDINDAILGVYTDSKTVEMADTIAIPPHVWADIIGKVIEGTAMTVWQFIMQNNVYTARTGMPLMFRELRGLEDAAASSKGRLLAYRRDPTVLKLHLPMPYRFLEAYQAGPLVYMVPGILRLGGLEIRRPKAIRYVDQITS